MLQIRAYTSCQSIAAFLSRSHPVRGPGPGGDAGDATGDCLSFEALAWMSALTGRDKPCRGGASHVRKSHVNLGGQS